MSKKEKSQPLIDDKIVDGKMVVKVKNLPTHDNNGQKLTWSVERVKRSGYNINRFKLEFQVQGETNSVLFDDHYGHDLTEKIATSLLDKRSNVMFENYKELFFVPKPKKKKLKQPKE